MSWCGFQSYRFFAKSVYPLNKYILKYRLCLEEKNVKSRSDPWWQRHTLYRSWVGRNSFRVESRLFAAEVASINISGTRLKSLQSTRWPFWIGLAVCITLHLVGVWGIKIDEGARHLVDGANKNYEMTIGFWEMIKELKVHCVSNCDHNSSRLGRMGSMEEMRELAIFAKGSACS